MGRPIWVRSIPPPVHHRWQEGLTAAMLRFVRTSAYRSIAVCPILRAQQRSILGLWLLYRTPIGNPMLQVKTNVQGGRMTTGSSRKGRGTSFRRRCGGTWAFHYSSDVYRCLIAAQTISIVAIVYVFHVLPVFLCCTFVQWLKWKIWGEGTSFSAWAGKFQCGPPSHESMAHKMLMRVNIRCHICFSFSQSVHVFH